MILYPIRVQIDNQKVIIRDKEDFDENYDYIFNSTVVSAIKNVDYNDLYSNYQGIMIGNGEVWMSKVEDEMKIIAINN